MSTFPRTRRRRRTPEFSAWDAVIPLEVSEVINGGECSHPTQPIPVCLRKISSAYSGFFYHTSADPIWTGGPWGIRLTERSVEALKAHAFKVEEFKTGTKVYLNPEGMEAVRKVFPDGVDQHPMNVS